MQTIWDDLADIDSVKEVVGTFEYDPDTIFGAYMATVSGLSVADMITATLLKVGYSQDEIAEYRGVKKNSINKQLQRAIKKIY